MYWKIGWLDIYMGENGKSWSKCLYICINKTDLRYNDTWLRISFIFMNKDILSLFFSLMFIRIYLVSSEFRDKNLVKMHSLSSLFTKLIEDILSLRSIHSPVAGKWKLQVSDFKYQFFDISIIGNSQTCRHFAARKDGGVAHIHSAKSLH